MTIVAVIAAIWLIVSPWILGLGTGALWTTLIAGVVAGALALLGSLGAARFYGVSAVGVFMVVMGFIFGGAALWSSLIAGIVLVVAGYLAAQQEGGAALPRASA